MTHSAPAIIKPTGTVAAIKKALGRGLLLVKEANGEVAIHVKRDALVGCMVQLRDTCGYQQLMEIAGVDWPDREPRFEIVYCLLSLTKNHRIRVHVTANEDTPVPSVTEIWPVAGWLEREVFDMYGVLFSGNDQGLGRRGTSPARDRPAWEGRPGRLRSHGRPGSPQGPGRPA